MNTAVASDIPTIKDVMEARALSAAGRLRGLFWIKDEHYHHPECPGVSSTRLKAILRSPAHYIQGIEDPEETAAMIFGRQVHEMLLQPERFWELYARAVENPYDWNKERKEYLVWKAARQEALGPRMELAASTWDSIAGIVDAVWEKRSAAGLLEGSEHYELACFTVDEETGITIRVKVDAINFALRVITDLKTCQDARKEPFRADVKKFKYPLSAALYMDVINKETGAGIDSFVWIAVEKKRPHGVWCHAATQPMLDLGRKQYREALVRLKQCMDSGVWGCYPDEITDLEFTDWQLKELNQ